MKPRRKLLIISGSIVAIFLAFCAGRIQGTAKTVYHQNAANLVWFTSIHNALEKGDTDTAREVCEKATSAHIDVIARSQYTSGELLAYGLPFIQSDPRSDADRMLEATLTYSEEYLSFLDQEQVSELKGILED